MRSASFLVVLILAAVTLAAFGSDFWTSKPYVEWTDKEAAKILTNSPWAHAVVITNANPGDTTRLNPAIPGSKPPSANLPDGGPGPMDATGALPDGTRRPGDGPSANSGPGVDAMRALVRWQSAAPVKQALLVQKGKTDLTSPEDAKRFLESGTHYVLSISGLRMALPLGSALRAAKEAVRGSAALSAKGRDPILPENVEIAGRANGVEILVLFPKANPIRVDDREIEFRTATPAGSVQAKFRLKDMMIAGQPAL